MGEGEVGMSWKSNIEAYTLPYIKYIASGHWLCDAMLCDNLEGWDGVGAGREVEEGRDICIPMADSCWCMAETNNIVKQLSSN